MSASEVLFRFLAALRRCLEGLRSEYFGVEREAGRGLVAYPRGGGPGVREGKVTQIGEFSLHGMGCYFELSTGEVVDVDWNEDGDPVFNLYRLRMYARSLRTAAVPDDEELEDAADWLVSRGVLQGQRGGWYAVRMVGG